MKFKRHLDNILNILVVELVWYIQNLGVYI